MIIRRIFLFVEVKSLFSRNYRKSMSFSRRVAHMTLLFCVTLALAGSARAEQWLAQTTLGGTSHFFMPNRIERFDLNNRQWLSPITLPAVRGNATYGLVDADGIYVAYGKSVYRYALDGSGEVHLVNLADPVLTIFSDGNLLLLNHSTSLYAKATSINKTNNQIIATAENYIYALGGASISPGVRKMFGRTTGVSPSDICYLSYNANGTFGTGGDSPHHGDYPGATRTWVFPDQSRVVDDSGTIYSTSSLTYLNSFGSTINDLCFSGTDVPIILKGQTVTAYTNTFLPTGSAAFTFAPGSILVNQNDVIGFGVDAGDPHGVRFATIALSQLSAPTPNTPADPNGVPFTPDSSFVDNDGVLSLFSKAHKSIFRWDSTLQTYVTSIGLIGVPDYVAYSSATHSIFLAYTSGAVNVIRLSSTPWKEVAFLNLPMRPIGMAAAGSYLLTVDDSGAWCTHRTFNNSGVQMDAEDWNYYSTEYIWSPVQQKMYFFRDDTSPNDILWEELNADGTKYTIPIGAIGTKLDSPLHTSTGFTHPIRLSKDQSTILLGSGMMHDAVTLARLSPTIPNTFTDAAWRGNGVTTLRTISGLSQYQLWTGGTFAAGTSAQYPGTAHRLISLDETRMLGISIAANGIPSIDIFSNSLAIVPPAALQKPAGLSAVIASSAINLAWKDVSGDNGYNIERRTDGGPWLLVGTTTVSLTTWSDVSLVAGATYSYRVSAVNGGIVSPASDAVDVFYGVPAQITTLAAVAVSASQVNLSWADATNETAYKVMRRTPPTTSWTIVSNPAANVTSASVTGLSASTVYEFSVIASNNIGASPHSNIATATTHASPPAAPSLSTPVVDSLTPKVTLTWSNVASEDNYVIERRIGTTGAWEAIGQTEKDVVTYVDTALVRLTTYYYRVYARNSAGFSSYSSSLSASIPDLPPPGTPVANAYTISSTCIRVSWTAASNADVYRVLRWLDSAGPVTVTETTALLFDDTTVAPGFVYDYKVEAVNTKGTASSSVVRAAAVDYVDLITDPFQPSPNMAVWSSIVGGSALNAGAGFPADNVLWFGQTGSRVATTLPIDFSLGGRVAFTWRAGDSGRDGTGYWENSDAGEGIVLEYSLNGLTWTQIASFDTVYPKFSSWTVTSAEIPVGAWSNQTRLRWRQLSNSGTNFDTWALDSVTFSARQNTVPNPPQTVSASPDSWKSAGVWWSEVDGATLYKVERSLNNETWQIIATVNQAFYADTSLAPSTAYYYRVRAGNTAGLSSPSPVSLIRTFSLLESWRFQNFGTIQNDGASASSAVNRNGISNLIEYAFNIPHDTQASALTAGTGTAGLPRVYVDPSTSRLTVEFVRRSATPDPGITCSVQFSSDLVQWSSGGTLRSQSAIDSSFDRVVWQDDFTVFEKPVRFVRVKVKESPAP